MAENNSKAFDLIVIGAGPGGYVCAIRAAQLGMSVACVERQYLGGTCLNVGCIPSKALLDSSELFYEAGHSFAKHGITVGNVGLDLPAMMKRKSQVVDGLTQGVGGLFKKNKVTHVRGHGRLAGNGKVIVKDGNASREISAKHIVIATGSAPIQLPSIPFDGKHIVSSTDAIAFGELPKKMIVIGAGAIGLELGSVWARLGTDVTVIEFMDRIVPQADREMTTLLQRALEKQGLKFHLKTAAETAKIEGAGVKVTVATEGKKSVIEADRVLVGVGRKPYTDDLGLKEIGIESDKRGFISVDAHYHTKAKGVYAIGDVIGGTMLAHKAEEEGVAIAELLAGKPGHVNYKAVPNVVYTNPELASVGMNEDEARARGEVRVGKFPFLANGRARAMNSTDGLVKVIADAATDRLLGMHIVGPRASDIITEGAIAMEFAASVEDIARSIHAHPTLPEAIKEAAMAAEKRAIHI